MPMSLSQQAQALGRAVALCDLPAVERHLAGGVDPNAPGPGPHHRTALAHLPSTAAAESVAALLTVLLNAGADPHHCDAQGNSALFYVILNGQRVLPAPVLRLTTMLLDVGVGIDRIAINTDQKPGSPWREVRPLHQACAERLTSLFLLLLERGADPLADPTPTLGWTALHFAAVDPPMAVTLTRLGADPHRPSVEGDTPMSLSGTRAVVAIEAARVVYEQQVLRAVTAGTGAHPSPGVTPGRDGVRRRL